MSLVTMADLAQLELFVKLGTQIAESFKKGSPVTLKPSVSAAEAYDAAVEVITNEINRRKQSGRPRRKGAAVTKTAARFRQYRETGSTVGWERHMPSTTT